MTRTIIAIAAAFALAGCANSAGEFANKSAQQWQTMGEAAKAALPAMLECGHGKTPREVPRQQFVGYMACYNRVEEAQVLPVINHPDLYQKVIATRTENASLYSQGKIDYEQLKARMELAKLDFNEAAQAREDEEYNYHAAQDEAENNELAAAAATFKQNRPVYTNCTSYGMTTNCISR